MALASSSALSISSSSTFVDAKASRQKTAASAQCVTLPTLPPPPVSSLQSRPWKTTAGRKVARNVMLMATGDAPTEYATAESPEIIATSIASAPAEISTVESSPELIKAAQEAWDKVEDKYAVGSLAVAGVIFLVASAGVIAAIDRLPLIPGVLEIVGICYTGWFVYKNVIFKPERQALIKKVKDTYKEITGSSS